MDTATDIAAVGAIITDGAAAADTITARAITVTDRKLSLALIFAEPLPRRK
jgi:hypothetical protein